MQLSLNFVHLNVRYLEDYSQNVERRPKYTRLVLKGRTSPGGVGSLIRAKQPDLPRKPQQHHRHICTMSEEGGRFLPVQPKRDARGCIVF